MDRMLVLLCARFREELQRLLVAALADPPPHTSLLEIIGYVCSNLKVTSLWNTYCNQSNCRLQYHCQHTQHCCAHKTNRMYVRIRVNVLVLTVFAASLACEGFRTVDIVNLIVDGRAGLYFDQKDGICHRYVVDSFSKMIFLICYYSY